MKLPESLASVHLNGVRFPLGTGITTIGQLKFNLVMEQNADNFYSWVVSLENDSDERSPRISEFLGMDISFPTNGKTQLNTLRGDDCTLQSFFPESFDLTDGTTIKRRPTGGRSSNVTAFPYFDIVDSAGEGIVCGIGWSGQWKLDVTQYGGDIRIMAGFQDCDFILEPHEKVRSIRALIYFGDGGEDNLRHQFVRLHRKHYSPVPSFDRDTYFPLAAQCFDRYYWGNDPVDGKLNYFETEDAHLHIIDNAAKCQYINAFWLDACWFEGAFRNGVGNYSYASGFPNTLKKIGAHAHRKGMHFILWFEPVRVHKDTELYHAYSYDNSKIITIPGDDRFLANLGDPDVWQYQFDHISKIIEENGVDMYRQDFNIDPYEFLKSIETPDRVGIAQIRFVEGMYRLWDALVSRFPGLTIDNCASGGRLLDVETLTRALPLWRSDMGCRPSPAAMQNEILSLSRYIPYHMGSTFDQSAYFVRSAATTSVSCELAFLSGAIAPEAEANSLRAVSGDPYTVSKVKYLGDFEPAVVQKALKDAVDLREYWNGDFTALTPPSDSKTSMLAYTLHLAEEDRGVVLVFRREEAPDTFVVKLPQINAAKEYNLVFSDENYVETQLTVSGKQLLDGLAVTIDTAPGSLVIKYKGI